jgi:hypothetical protein
VDRSLYTLLSNLIKKTIRKRLVLAAKIAFGTAYLLMGGEVFLRIFAPEPILPRYICATDYGVRGNEPNRSFWHTTPEYRINIRTNSKGIRTDEEIPYNKPNGIKRIVLLGDSFGIGYGVNLEGTFSEQMKKILGEAGIKCQIVNLSVSGHGTAEQLIALREEGLRYQPDLVLLAWHGSDLADNIRSNLFQLEKGCLVHKSRTYLPGVKTREFLFQFEIYRWMAEHSHLYSCVRENAARLVKYTILPAIRNLSNASNPKQELCVDAIESAAMYRKDLAIALLEEIKRECISNGAEFLIFDIPMRLGRSEFKSTFPIYNNEVHSFNVFCPLKLFRDHKGEIIYWEKSHGHFTPLGCRIVGEGLSKFIISNNLLDKPISTSTRPLSKG